MSTAVYTIFFGRIIIENIVAIVYSPIFSHYEPAIIIVYL